jgi:LysM repeat protein
MPHPSSQPHRFLLVLLIALCLVWFQPALATSQHDHWGIHPPLSYFALNASLQDLLRREARLTPAHFAQVQKIAVREQAQLRSLLEASQAIIADPNLSLEQKRLYVQRSGYNRRVEAILYASDRSLQLALDPTAYARLAAWMERRWPLEVQQHGRPPATLNHWLIYNQPSWLIPLSAPRTYEIFATRYDAKGRFTAALPDQCVKLTNGGLRTCADQGYITGQRYEIFMSYKNGKKGVGVVVSEAGPWNIDDNFWATLADPTPRRMFADLPLGMPEAQAAFYNGYNGGQDQYGRKVTAPFAIDLAFEVADDLGLPAKTNDWINVSFMWTDGWGSGAASSSGQGTGAQPAAISPVETALFKPDGSQVHTVQAGQTLWAIAVAYGVTIQQLRELNGMPAPSAENQSEVIIPGQTLIVRPAGPTPESRGGSETRHYQTPPATTDAPDNPSARRTEKAARKTATAAAGIVDPSATTPAGTTSPEHSQAGTPVAGIVDPGVAPATVPPVPGEHAGPPLLFIIGGLLLAGLGLYLLGRWLSRA